MRRSDGDNRVSMVVWGACILAAVGLVVCGVLLGSRFLPGLLGEWAAMCVGLLTTPFILEASFIFFGLVLVMLLNHWRQKREGDEFVYLEQLDDKDAAKLPDHAKWAVFRDKPLDGEVPTLQAQAEGALAIGDHAAAAECFAAMSGEELSQPGTLALRLELAQATGCHAMAAELERELQALRGTGEVNARTLRD